MNLVISNEHVFLGTDDGVVRTNGAFSYSYWERYLEDFDHVYVIARIRYTNDGLEQGLPSSGSRVHFIAIPPYHGISGVVAASLSTVRRSLAAVPPDSLLLLRSPGTIGTLLALACMCSRRSFAVEVVSDPWDVFMRGVTGRRSAPIVRPLAAGALWLACRQAAGVAYVTEETLQRRYPPGRSTTVGSYSHVELPEEAFARRSPDVTPRVPHQLAFVGSLAARYKGLDILLRAMAEARSRGVEFALDVVGGGQHQGEFTEMARNLGIGAKCRFLGQMPSGEEVRRVLRAADVFVLPSLTEGLPSALVEAMALSMPCVASRVGGIPELLEAEFMFEPGDWRALAHLLVGLAADPQRRAAAGLRNYEQAQRFQNARLRDARTTFFSQMRDVRTR